MTQQRHALMHQRCVPALLPAVLLLLCWSQQPHCAATPAAASAAEGLPAAASPGGVQHAASSFSQAANPAERPLAMSSVLLPVSLHLQHLLHPRHPAMAASWRQVKVQHHHQLCDGQWHGLLRSTTTSSGGSCCVCSSCCLMLWPISEP